MKARTFRATIEPLGRGRGRLVLPFDPAEVWGARQRYHVTGTVDGHGLRGPVRQDAGSFVLQLGVAWMRDRGISPGRKVSVSLTVEGPQRQSLAPDISAALEASPDAASFFDSLATFYRKGYLTWVDATKRRPDVRAQRIAEMVRLLKAGRRQRP